MKPNPVLKKLGYSDTDRLVILHTDDIGMCQASVQAFTDLWENGTISSGAVMMPCPWAKAAADYCQAHPGVDMGVHATLNAEWDLYRWGPLSTCDPGSGFIDTDGFFFQEPEETQAKADPDAALTELRLQVRKALEWGVGITHVDSHMGTTFHPKFLPAYVQVAQEARVPVMIPRGDPSAYEHLMGMKPPAAAGFASFTAQLEEQGMPLVDGIMMMPLDQPDGQVEIAKKLLGALPPGVTHFLFHPSVDTPELRAIAPDWPSRVANYHTFMDKEITEFMQNIGVQVIGYSDLKKLIQ